MAVIAKDRTVERPSFDGLLNQDQFILLGDVLDIHRAHFPGSGVASHPERNGSYDCRLVSQEEIQPFRIEGPERWADYRGILQAYDDRRKAGSPSHTAPDAPDSVFATVKVVIAERDEPLRATLTFSPLYPTRGKVALPRPGHSTSLIYAAVAVLNSAVGQALYRQILQQHEGRSRAKDGISAQGLRNLPIAPRDYNPAYLGKVALLTHQMMTLYEAEHHCNRRFPDEIE
ncbi:MAG: hypothetical protein M3Y56_16875, partial [Armatimonadota bacterium]|nr:hypothetical protein [Armatimonadota bacterium]